MFNQVILTGHLVDNPKFESYKDEVSYTTFTLAVSRPFKNSDGEYEADFIRIVTWEGVARATADYCRKGDLIMVKGRLNVRSSEFSFEGESEVIKRKLSFLQVIGERVIFLSTTGKTSQYEESISDNFEEV